MNILKREESLERLADKLNQSQLKNVITKGYSDMSLSLMAEFKSEYAVKISDTIMTANGVNKLAKAYFDEKIDAEDLLRITSYASVNNSGEKYIDDFLKSIDDGVYHKTAAKILAAVNYEDCTYSDALFLCKQGIYYPTDYGGLSVEKETAWELSDLGVPLRGCQGFNYCYDIDNVGWSIGNGDAIFVKDKNLAAQVHSAMKQSDWKDFKAYIIDRTGGKADSLTGDDIVSLHEDFIGKDNRTLLHNKIEAEHKAFMVEMVSGTVENAIESAYEIVVKNDIQLYAEVRYPHISDEQFKALLSSNNALHEIYEEYRNNGELSSFEDIELAMKNVADKIMYSSKRDKEINSQNKENVPENKPPQTVKPKHKSR